MKKITRLILTMLGFSLMLAACDNVNRDTISVISREDGSGTRGAFIELFGIEQKDASGAKIDYTTIDALITNSTSVMMTTIANNPQAIGYISLGSLNHTVKAVQIDGVAPSVESVKDGSYKIARPFNIVTNDTTNPVAIDFISYILSNAGQKVIEENKYIANEANAYTTTQPTGKVVIAGSSSVTPVMEKLKESYILINPHATIEIQQSDSTTGINAVISGIADIGMASRTITDSEKTAGVTAQIIAMDGIAVIINNDNTHDNLTNEDVQAIFTGEKTTWSEIA